MNKYPDNDKFSLEPGFHLLYEGRPLMTEGELSLLKSYSQGAGTDAGLLADIDARFLEITGKGALDKDSSSLSPECRNAMAIFEIKAHLSREQLVHRWKSPSVAADSLVCSGGMVLLIRRKKDPYGGYYALPGGILDEDETLEECAVRELREETGLNGRVAGLLSVFSDPRRDPRVRMVSAIFVVDVVSGSIMAGDDAADAKYVAIDDLPPLAYDHDRAISEFRNSRFFKQRA